MSFGSCQDLIRAGDLTLLCPRFAEKIVKASKGEKGIIEPTYVYLPGVSGGEAIAKETGVDYFSVPVELGVSSIGLDPILQKRG